MSGKEESVSRTKKSVSRKEENVSMKAESVHMKDDKVFGKDECASTSPRWPSSQDGTLGASSPAT